MIHGTENKRIVVKIGSSSLTSSQGELSRRKLEKLINEVVLLKDEGYEVLLVSSGAVAAGYRKLGCLTRPDTLPERQAAASIGQGLLMETYSELFVSHGYIASQILLTRSDLANEERYNNAQNTINVLLERGVIPIVNENDSVTTDELKFGDNDTLSAKVAALVDANQLIVLSDVDGLYDGDPKSSDSKLIEHVYDITEEIESVAGGSGSSVGTGGMRSKIDAFKIAMASGISAFLGRATVSNIIYDAAHLHARGTYFDPNPDSLNLDKKQQWIAFNSGPEGELVLKNSRVGEIIEEEVDIHPKDVDTVRGSFEKGAVVRILDEANVEVGLGVVNFSSTMMKQWHDVDPNLKTGNEIAIDKEQFVCHLTTKVSMKL
ncbi:glutamate 5-kinase [Pontibacillus yanchengensis]|uniref:Glutamate 5-kinase n=2 Tax=Pontibacillus yanchengensis TaxID=462910 RepID=A0ACC7VCR9_9BACI|nr:glutamate 5-kinase [Pontibacillus yanchengensis]MYL32010.1 glutamate 5-kinase [Pontibacillus yanchengensis]MYL52587.1 glutamate 5-kinase [Pontibacillus yanchengensis]